MQLGRPCAMVMSWKESPAPPHAAFVPVCLGTSGALFPNLPVKWGGVGAMILTIGKVVGGQMRPWMQRRLERYPTCDRDDGVIGP